MVALNILSLSAIAWTLSSAVPALAAAVNKPPSYPAPVTTRCYTALCTASTSKVKTSWSTKWTPCTKTTTVTSTSTTTPAASTSTSTVFTTTTSTAPASFETQTTTETENDSTTITNTATETTSTVVSTTATSTIPTSSGFIPVQSSLPGSTCDGDCGTNPVQKRGSNEALARRVSPNPTKNLFKGPPAKAQKYPKSVSCIKWSPSAKCSTKTKTVTQTKTAPVPTSTAITTSTITETFVPSATTTVSDTTTTTTTSTATASTTTTTTTTSTSTVSTVSVYAACATNNIASLYNGQGVYNFNEGSGQMTTVTSVPATSAYDYCVANLLNAAGNSQFYAYQISPPACFISSGSSCPSGSASKTFTVNTGSKAYVFGNGYCGEMIPQ